MRKPVLSGVLCIVFAALLTACAGGEGSNTSRSDSRGIRESRPGTRNYSTSPRAAAPAAQSSAGRSGRGQSSSPNLAANPGRASAPADYSRGLNPNVRFVPWSRNPPAGDGRSTGNRTYKVQPGDSLSSIARKFYGNTESWQLIYQANRNIIDNPDNLPENIELTIPATP